MTLIDSIASYMETNSIGVKSETIWGELPLEKENSIGLVAAPSPEPNKAIRVYQQTVDVWGRFTKASEGKAKLQQVMDLIHGGQNYAIEDFHVYFSYAASMIDDMGRDPESRHLYKLTLVFIYRLD